MLTVDRMNVLRVYSKADGADSFRKLPENNKQAGASIISLSDVPAKQYYLYLDAVTENDKTLTIEY